MEQKAPVMKLFSVPIHFPALTGKLVLLIILGFVCMLSSLCTSVHHLQYCDVFYFTLFS